MKILFSSDWHFGESNDSKYHNEKLLEFTQFLIDYAKEHNITTFCHGGDFFHHREKVNVSSLNKGIEAARMLSKSFGKENYIQIKGNHDLYYRDTREINSLEAFSEYATLVDDYHIIDNVMFVSWVCNGEEYDKIVNISKKKNIDYMFGHFEFSQFKMNDHYVMEHGQTHKSLSHLKRVLTGHYHMRQEKDNVIYVGSPFPFNYNDANDDQRGFLVLDTETNEVEWVNFDKVKVLSVDYKDFLSNDFDYDPENTSIRVVVEDIIDNDTIDQLQDRLKETEFRDSKLQYKGNRNKVLLEQETELSDDIMNVDDTVISHLKNMSKIEGIDNNLLVSIYKEAQEYQNG